MVLKLPPPKQGEQEPAGRKPAPSVSGSACCSSPRAPVSTSVVKAFVSALVEVYASIPCLQESDVFFEKKKRTRLRLRAFATDRAVQSLLAHGEKTHARQLQDGEEEPHDTAAIATLGVDLVEGER